MFDPSKSDNTVVIGAQFATPSPVGKATQDSKHAADKANMAKGEALAEMLFRCVKEQGSTLKRFLVNIAELDQQGRRGFRVAVQRHLKDIRAHVNAREGQDDHAAWAATARSAGVRMSEAVTFSKAVDAGYSPGMEHPYHSLIGGARTFLQGQSTGPTVKKGRPVKPLLDKIKDYLERECKSKADFEAAAQLAETMAALRA